LLVVGAEPIRGDSVAHMRAGHARQRRVAAGNCDRRLSAHWAGSA